jgi:aldoxime dehydratase
MTCFGVQFRGNGAPADAALDELDAALSAVNGPGRVERARYVDEAGFSTLLTIAYWDDPFAHARWFPSARTMWLSDQHVGQGAGFFIESLRPSVSRFETLLSSDRTEGIAGLADTLSGEVVEHAYWGAARDRIALAQTDPLTPGRSPAVSGDSGHRLVTAQNNLCLIRSGQDWTDTAGEERRMYLEQVEPLLRAGMEFLRDQGRSVGCYANRYMQVLDEDGRPTDKSFGMSWWRNLTDLEAWAENHPTHQAIFGQAMSYFGTLGPAARLRLFHEITIAASDEQHLEYVGCHPQTGLLRAATSSG